MSKDFVFDTIVSFVWAMLLILLVATLSGCASRAVVAPSTVGIQDQVRAAASNNLELGTNNTRMEHKEVIIDRWLETQP